MAVAPFRGYSRCMARRATARKQYSGNDCTSPSGHVIAHEYIHIQQSKFLGEDGHPTVLDVSLIEGSAEFIGEMVSGGVANPGVWAEAKGHEAETEASSVSHEDKTDLSK
jgi:uncharacterized protein YjaZ